METANSAAVLILDLPQSAFAGIDLLSFTASPRFRGVKNLPLGFHFVFTGTSTAFSERHGIWFHVTQHRPSSPAQPLTVTKWVATAETLELETDDTALLRWRTNLDSVWHEGLTPYRQSAAAASDEPTESDWSALTSSITPALLSRVLGSTVPQRRWRLTSASSAQRDLEAIPGLSNSDATAGELAFLAVDLKRTWRAGATGRERTEAAQDRSWALEQLVATTATTTRSEWGQELLGELQLCFLMVLTLNNFSCLEQWKRLLGLTLTCQRAVGEQPAFFARVLAALRLQLLHCKDAEGGLIDLADESGSLLRSLLARFRKGLEGLHPGVVGVQDVFDELDELEEYLSAEHGWQFGGTYVRSGRLELEDGEEVTMETTAFDEDDETGEFAPQIVELTAEQARLLDVDAADTVGTTPTRERVVERASVKANYNGNNQGHSIEIVVNGSDDSDDDADEETQDLEDMDSRF